LRRGLDRGLREREASRRRAAGLGTPSAPAGRMRASLVHVFTVKLPNTNARLAFLPMYNQLQKDAGEAPTKPSF
jgi:hypothetical protein